MVVRDCVFPYGRSTLQRFGLEFLMAHQHEGPRFTNRGPSSCRRGQPFEATANAPTTVSENVAPAASAASDRSVTFAPAGAEIIAE